MERWKIEAMKNAADHNQLSRMLARDLEFFKESYGG